MMTQSKTGTQSIAMQIELPHPPAKVWRALTDPALLAKWLMENDIRPMAGESFTFRSQPTKWWDGIVRCDVLAVEPNKRITYSWRSGSPPEGLDTVVTWTLTPTSSGGTHLALEHSGFRPSDAQAFDGAGKGWHKILAKLEEVLSSES
jgi:uncharacterized protein YndB with AHSA1/START domain